uniref:Uncharacterized protein n=1 Tax=viral metagenome TaxID=1070528 RepID=A0A6C0BZL3_9ZZZZ
MVCPCAHGSGIIEQSAYPYSSGMLSANPVVSTSASAPSRFQCGSVTCGFVLFVILFCILWFFWNPRRSTTEVIVEKSKPERYGASGPGVSPSVSSRPYNQPAGQLAQVTGPAPLEPGCVNPQAPVPIEAINDSQYNTLKANNGASVPSLPKSPEVTVPLAGGGASLTGGAPIDSSTYGLSDESAEYYKTFQPISLESTMPMGWRSATNSSKCASGGDDIYNEFSRYAISPNQMKRAENMRSVLRLGESSRDGLSRTLGQRSLLRDFVTPLGPSPIGDKAMLWNDSSVRQNYIASATGRFPTVAENC